MVVQVHKCLDIVDRFGFLGIGLVGARGRALLDLSVITGVIAALLWWFMPQGWAIAKVGSGVVLIVVWLGTVRRVGPGHGWIAPRLGVSTRALGEASLLTLLMSGVLIATAWSAGWLDPQWGFGALRRPSHEVPLWLGRKLFTVLFQQLLLQTAVFPLCLEITRRAWSAAALSAVVFAGVHSPNLFLVAATVGVVPIWLWLYGRHRGAVVPLVLSHLVLALVLRLVVVDVVHLNLAVGARAVPAARRLVWLHRNDLWSTVQRYSSAQYYAAHGASPRPYVQALFADTLGTEPTQHVVREIERLLMIESRARLVVELLVQEAYWRPRKLRPP